MAAEMEILDLRLSEDRRAATFVVAVGSEDGSEEYLSVHLSLLKNVSRDPESRRLVADE